ncbi:Fe2OG dioxygenase domain-containing protein [Balamuthia mandrillaris]
MEKTASQSLMSRLRTETVCEYSTKEYDFESILRKIFDWQEKDLNLLHEKVAGSSELPPLTFEWDQKTVYHQTYYNSPLLPEMLSLYERFVKEVVAPQFEGEVAIVYQRKPTFRVHLPNNFAVPHNRGPEERPGLHCDSEYNHPPGEINFWHNTMWTESEPFKEDWHPALLSYGQFLRFNGNLCRHYGNKNASGLTRVSVDFRVVPMSQWDETAVVKASVQSFRKFIIGDYFEEYQLPSPSPSHSKNEWGESSSRKTHQT